MRLELTAFRLWDWRAAYCAKLQSVGLVFFDHSCLKEAMWKSVQYSGSLAEWSKALVLGTSPKGRGFESHSCQMFVTCVKFWVKNMLLIWIIFFIDSPTNHTWKFTWASVWYNICRKKSKNDATSGNRTRAARVAGEHSTTEPTLLICNKYSMLISS